MTMVRVKDKIRVKEVSKEEYESGLSDYCYSLFLTSAFMESVADGKQIIYLHFERGGAVVAKIAGLVEYGSRITGRYFYFYAGPALIEKSEQLYNDCLTPLLKFARRKRLSKIDMLYYDQQYQWKCNAKGFYHRTNREFVRFLENEEEPLKFSKSIKYNSRKAAKLEPKLLEETSQRILDKLHELLSETQRIRNEKFNGKYYPYPYKNMSKEAVDKLFAAGLLRLYYLEVDGEIHCVRCALVRDKRMYGIMIAADEFAYANGLQHYLQHHLITQIHKEGYKYYNVSIVDFGEDGLVSYKESLGCKLHKVHGAYTHFITFPHVLLNPVMNTGRFLAKSPLFAKVVKFGSKIIAGRDDD
ncbi:GNAT family N-acetyltransferase [Alkalitalea saponilacus]|uniref:Acetyltransferase (GNAT) domain-containing protein n=1 Tax=Alkalitalea saponilacus TaxID=889453 RepID=A0A1T5HS76_9BACT|nr:GNAT family N-acetyltransferase [Alkalitalea saponilacus]ASB48319.1 hypothetical protein CDL62_03750 [Alkalitalea saponilacus]SKC23544.1 Acetyltransferase (GNAT) domain-containing protein [Alkalitalea saponilacus]